jgi:hypothetical protein
MTHVSLTSKLPTLDEWDDDDDASDYESDVVRRSVHLGLTPSHVISVTKDTCRISVDGPLG